MRMCVYRKGMNALQGESLAVEHESGACPTYIIFLEIGPVLLNVTAP
jgi:hypothetical protein